METIKENIEGRIIPLLEKAGMYYRVFSRVKSKGKRPKTDLVI